ncbi:MAG: hypothetical protein L6Q54_05040 [Leptospiraceae bacterium]|nr:hypothetical protein [Leptospiraceae bacterium]MCK6380602.1 hypothetical protein [Leptospiraceae bacterium]NUM42114.1 hypothetical protein [Leptospiraceae bacterium]
MKKKEKEIFGELTVEEISYYYTLLNEELTNFDCGSLCKDQNDGVPFCCVPKNAVPFLYRKEFQLLKSRSELWRVWEPKTAQEKKLKSTHEGEDTLFCECKGVAFCERENRSISCRTFPFEPYLDKRGVLVGLIFMKEFLTSCPLSSRLSDIRQEYIDGHFLFWEKLLLRKKDEYDTYKKSSSAYRRWSKKENKKIPLLFPSHLKDKDYLKKLI